MALAAQIDLMQEGVLFDLPMPLTLRPPYVMSDEDLIAFSRRNKPYRIERNSAGELEVMSPVGFDGGQRELMVGAALFDWSRKHGGTSLSSNSGFRLPDTSVRSPDASWISAQRVDRLTREERRGFAPICPDFLIEVFSETDSRPALERKMEMWIAAGTQLAWMIDPYLATVSIYQPGKAVSVLDRPDSVEAGDPVAGFRLSTLMLWDK